jgi:Glycosyltransferase family 87
MPWSFIQNLNRRLSSVSPKRRIYLLVLVWALFYGALIAFDALYLRNYLYANVGSPIDISFYRERTEGVLNGLWLYRDIPCESPPLIVYLMIPGQLAGGSDLAYQIWFTIFILLTSLTIYLALRRYDDAKAFWVALLFIFIPTSMVETVFGMEDEAIVIFIFVLSILLAVIGRLRWSAVAMTIGIWTKILNIFLAPFLLRASKPWRERMVLLGIVLGLSFLICLPFLIVCPQEFLSFPFYYSLNSGSGDKPTSNLNIWDFLSMGGLQLPSWAYLALTIGALIVAYYFGLKRNRTILEGMLIVLTAFILIYPRTTASYYTFPIALLLIWGVEDRWLTIRCLILSIPLYLSLLFTSNNSIGEPFIEWQYGWVVGVVLQIMVIVILLDSVRVALGKRNFVDRALEAQRQSSRQ